MVRASGLALGLGLLSAGLARAVDQPLYQPPPAWVTPVAIPSTMKPSGAAADVLLFTSQNHLAPDDDETFVERAVRINAPEGLQQAGSLVQVWNPLTDTLIIHQALILRAGKTIDLLAGGRRFTVLRRETNLEAAMIDGQLTATLQPEGLQVGDVLDAAYTLIRREPALAGHSMSGALVGHAGVIGRLRVSAEWPQGRAYHIWKTDDLPAMAPQTRAGWTSVSFDQTNAVSPEPPTGAPTYDGLFGLMAVSDFKDWKDVSAIAYPLYDRAARLSATSPLQAEIARIRAGSSDPKSRALAALKVVEGQTRYLFLADLDAGGLTPAAADLTWSRRFGDCKGKTVLLLALLRGLDVKAEPALVSTNGGEALDREPPSMGVFNHVIIRAEIDGRPYWLDGTRMGDENLDVIAVPNDHWALPLRPEGAGLEPIGPAPPVLPYVDTLVKVDARTGLDKPAAVHEEVVIRGDGALFFSLAMRQLSQVDGDRVLRQALTADRSWVQPDKLSFSYDPQTMQAHLLLDGSGVAPFSSTSGGGGGVRDWALEGASIGFDPDFNRPSPYHRDAPFAVSYPAFTRTVVQVDLPDHGKGFEADNGEAVSQTAAGVAYQRAAAITDGRLIMTASSRAVASSISVTEARASEAALRGMADYQTFVRYTPEAKVSATTSAPQSSLRATGDDPVEIAENDLLRKNYEAAEQGFTHALAAHPTSSLYYRRAVARAARGEDAAADADLQAALKLDPKNAYAAFGLGRYALRRKDLRGAAERFKAAQADSDKPLAMAKMIALAYEAAGQYADAYPYWDKVVSGEPGSDSRAQALNAACWSRAEAGRDLTRALQDCDDALKLSPGAADALDSRGLVDLRMSAADKARADYTAALAKRPDSPTSLYGRSIAEMRLGQADKAKADRAAAEAMNPKVDADFAGWGVSR